MLLTRVLNSAARAVGLIDLHVNVHASGMLSLHA